MYAHHSKEKSATLEQMVEIEPKCGPSQELSRLRDILMNINSRDVQHIQSITCIMINEYMFLTKDRRIPMRQVRSNHDNRMQLTGSTQRSIYTGGYQTHHILNTLAYNSLFTGMSSPSARPARH